jgi:hypothetical protein
MSVLLTNNIFYGSTINYRTLPIRKSMKAVVMMMMMMVVVVVVVMLQ